MKNSTSKMLSNELSWQKIDAKLKMRRKINGLGAMVF